MSRTALLTLAVAALGACAGRAPVLADPFSRERAPPLAVYSIDYWHAMVERSTTMEFVPREFATPAVDPTSGRVVVGTRDGVLRSVTIDGKIRWAVSTPAPFYAGVLIRDGVVYSPGGDGILRALKADTGAVIWAYDCGEELVTVPVTSERSRTDELIGGITRSTRVVCVSHVHWCTGTRVDLDRIASAARAVGAKVVVDGAHALGAIDVDASVADFYTGSTFKWLLSGFGVAYSMMRQRAAAEIEPVFRGYANEAPSRSLQYSHANYPVMYALEATLELLEGLGWQAIEARVSSLTETLHRELVAAGWEVVTPMESRAGIISIRDPNAPQTVARLLAERVEVEDRAGHLRVSPHFYNNEADLRRFLDVLGRNPG